MKNSTINDRVTYLLHKFNVKPAQVCKSSGIAPSNFSAFMRNKKSWGLDSLLKLSKYFNVTVDFFTNENMELKKDYTDALVDEMRRKLINNESLYIVAEDTAPYNSNTPSVNVYNKVSAGNPIEAWDNPQYDIYISHPSINKIKSRELFGFEIKGDSMTPRFREHDIVITKKLNLPVELPNDRDFVVTFFMDDFGTTQANLKLFNWANKEKKFFILSSLNTYYNPTTHSIKEVRYMFKVYLTISPIHYKKEK